MYALIPPILASWTLIPPDDAQLLAGGAGGFGWLNVANQAVTLSEAMSSDPVADQGFANAPRGTKVQVDFYDGVVNAPGADLVMLDAAFDIGAYRIRSAYDGYIAEVDVDMNHGVLVTSRDYYYENNGAGPFAADVFGVEIDLSDLGVPAGGVVYSLRFESLNDACDPIGLAALRLAFTLHVEDLYAGQTETVSVTGATASGVVGIGMSRIGTGPTMIDTGSCGVVPFSLTTPIFVLALEQAKANGKLSVTGQVPPNAAGTVLYFHAFDFGSCTASNVVTATVQ